MVDPTRKVTEAICITQQWDKNLLMYKDLDVADTIISWISTTQILKKYPGRYISWH